MTHEPRCTGTRIPGCYRPGSPSSTSESLSATDLRLTPAELRIAGFLPTHRSLREIAETLGLSRATVKSHVEAIYAKLGVGTRLKAVEQIAQAGIEPTGAKPG